MSASPTPSGDPSEPQLHEVGRPKQSRREYTTPAGKGVWDSHQRIMAIRLGMSFVAGAGVGFLFGGLLGAAIGGALAFGVPFTFLVVGGRLAQNVYHPSGTTTPHKREYSREESLVMRGLYEDAISAFELAILERDATDPTPYLRIARIYRDHLERYEDSARWFKQALSESDMHAGLVTLTRKELVELYAHRMNAPEKAAPMLARLAEALEGTPEGEWATAELGKIKRGMAGEEQDD